MKPSNSRSAPVAIDMERGYIALWRKVQDHEFWQEKRTFSKYEAWIDILMEARHSIESHNVMLGMHTVECGYGQSIKSVRTWARRWHWSESKVRRYFKLCENLGQIVTESVEQTTRLTVCNYASYDPKRRKSDTQDANVLTHSRRTPDAPAVTNNNGKNGNNVNHVKKDNVVCTIPENLDTPKFAEAWKDWEADRKERKKPITDRAKKAQLKKLSAWGHDKAIEVITNAIMQGWTGLYEPSAPLKAKDDGYVSIYSRGESE